MRLLAAPLLLASAALLTGGAAPEFPPLPGPLRFQQQLKGMLPGGVLKVRWALRFQGPAVTLEVVKSTQRGGAAAERAAVTYKGTWARDHRGVTMFVSHEQDSGDFPRELTLRCLRAVLDVLPAEADLISGDACKGDGPPPRWSPLRPNDVAVWHCLVDEESNRPWNGYQQHGPLAFAAGAGLEWLYVNNDCAGQEGAFRRLPPERR